MSVQRLTPVIETIRLATLNPPPPGFALRGLSEEHVAELRKSMEVCGQQTLLVVAKEADGRLTLFDGQHRVAAAKQIGMEALQAQVLGDHAAAGYAALVSNLKRRNLEGAELDAAIELLASSHEALFPGATRSDPPRRPTHAEIAGTLGTNTTRVKRTLARKKKLGEEARAALASGEITEDLANEVMSLPLGDQVKGLDIAKKAKAREFDRDEARAQIRQLHPRKSKGPSAPVAAARNDWAQLRAITAFDAEFTETKLKGLSPEELQELKTAIQGAAGALMNLMLRVDPPAARSEAA
ncbi:MAG: ParB/RepB/Spo0J family partition protein [Archangium sp.]|nr:ParB/RepB/Spo0J family partition protein [Archangium sp.]